MYDCNKCHCQGVCNLKEDFKKANQRIKSAYEDLLEVYKTHFPEHFYLEFKCAFYISANVVKFHNQKSCIE